MSWFGSEHKCGCTYPYDKNHCQYNLWAPGRDNELFERDVIGNTAFNLYAMEEEGLFLTREEKIQKVIDYLSSSSDPNDKFIQMQAFNLAKLDMNTLTFNEVNEIELEVARRWNNYHL